MSKLNSRISVRRIIRALFQNIKFPFRKFLIGFAVLIIFIASLLFLWRKEIISSKLQEKFNLKGFNVSYDEFEIEGISNLRFKNFEIRKQNLQSISLLSIKTAELNINIIESLFTGISIENISLENSVLNLIDSANINNFKTRNEQSSSKKNQLTSTNDRVKKYIKVLPKNVKIENFKLIYNDSGTRYSYFLNKGIKTGDSFNFQFNKFGVEGRLSKELKSFKLNINPHSDNQLNWKQAIINIPKTSIEITPMENAEVDFCCQFNCFTEDFNLFHPKISNQTVDIQSLNTNFLIDFEREKINIDKSSTMTLGNFEFNVGGFIKYNSKPAYSLSIQVPESDINNLFTSLPKGLFPYSSTVRAQGKWAYVFKVRLDSENFDSTIFQSEVALSSDYKIVDWGKISPKKYLIPFNYQSQKSAGQTFNFIVGDENPYYIPLDEINPMLIKAVLTSEDPQFYFHKGFYQEAFREALIDNYKKGKFARGGSTISMQLVKNLYLTHNKTLARKLEEILIVWLIEHEKAISKQRMLEIYLNIIEWGPGIFGIGQASWFYFQKPASALSIEECVYLASLIPAPTKSKWSINDNGKINPQWSRYFNLANRIHSLDSTIIKIDGINELSIHPEAVQFLRKIPTN